MMGRLRILFIIGLNVLFNLYTIGQTTPTSGDILFTHADADGEVFEFITLKRLNLNNLKFTDNGICSIDTLFRTNEGSLILPIGLNDIPCGTLVRININSSSTNDLDHKDGILQLNTSSSVSGSLDFNASGDQIISFIGNLNGSSNCIGSTGFNNYISGIDWDNGTTGWTTGSTSSNNSKAPNTPTDFAETTIAGTNDDAIWFNGIVMGNVTTIISSTGNGVRNTSNWSGTGTGTGIFTPLKNIQFHTSNYDTGIAIASSGGLTSSTINLSGLSFSNSNSDTRFLITINANASPSTPANRYTCYTPNTNYGLASIVVNSCSSPPCGGTSNGNGKVVYFNYLLPSSLAITGLSNNTCYTVNVYAVNGNGYSANFSSIPASFTFYTGNLTSSITAY